MAFNRLAARKAGYSDSEIDSYLSQSQPTEQAPQKSLTESIGSGVSNLLMSIIKPTAQAVATTGKNIVGAVAQTPLMLSQASSLSAQNNSNLPQWLQSLAGLNTKITQKGLDLLQPAGLSQQDLQNYSDNPLQQVTKQAKASANLASYAVPFGGGGNLLTKALLPGAVAGGLQALSEDDTNSQNVINKVLGGSALGGLTAGATEGVIGAGKGIMGLLGKGLTQKGESLAVKALRPNPSQVREFEGMAGEKFGQFLQKRGLVGANTDQIMNHTQAFQDGFDAIVRNPDLKITTSELFKSFEKEITRFADSSLPEQQAKGEYLQKIMDNLKKKGLGEAQGADVISNLKTEAAKLVKDFRGDDATKGKLQVLSDIYRSTVQDAADKAGMQVNGMSVKDAGRELQKLYELSDIAQKQSGLGKGSLPIGLSTLLGSGAGGIVGGPLGMVGGALATNALNSPAAISGMSKASTGLGRVLQGAAQNPLMDLIAGGGAQIRGQVASHLPGALNSIKPMVNQDQQTNNNEPTQQLNQGLPPAGSIQQDTQQPAQDQQQQLIQQALIFDLLKNKGRNVAQIKTLAGILNPQATGEDTKSQAKQKQFEKTINQLESLYGAGTDKSLSVKSTTGLSGILSRGGREIQKVTNQDYSDRLTQYKQITTQAVGVINQLRGAGALNEGEYKTLVDNIPNEYTSEKAAKSWFKNIRNLFGKDTWAAVENNNIQDSIQP